MKPGTRNPNVEVQQLHAGLTPSELAALLGPSVTHVFEPSPIPSESSAIGWTAFADDFARRLTARLRPLIRAAVRVTCSGSQLLMAETFSTSQEARDVVHLWQSAHSVEPIAVVLSVPLVATFVDRLLGGRSAPNIDDLDLHRPLTEIDRRFASKLRDAVRQSISDQTQLSSSLELTELPGNANSLVDAWLPDCSLVRLSFDLRFAQGGGTLDLLLPMELAETFVDPLDPADPPKTQINEPAMACLNVSSGRSLLVAQLGRTSLSQSDFRSLAVGDVLLMPTILDQSVRVLIDGRPVFGGIAGSLGGHKAIRLTKADSARDA